MGKISSEQRIKIYACPDCYLCGSSGDPLYADLEDQLFGVKGKWNMRRCSDPACGLLWLDPMPQPQEIAKLYENYFTHHERMGERLFARGLRQRLARGVLYHSFHYQDERQKLFCQLIAVVLSRIRFLRNRAGRSILWLDSGMLPSCLLDVGCGNGEFLVTMRDLGWDVTGIEQDPLAANVARKRNGLLIHTGRVEELGLPENSFDVVTMNHVVEHLTDPLQTLKALHRLLRPGGIIVISTPNTSSLGHKRMQRHWLHLDPPRHLHIFSRQNILCLLENANFRVHKCSTEAIAASLMLSASNIIKNKKKFIGENPLSSYFNHYKLTGFLFEVVEHLATGWPFNRPWGEELILTAEKNESIGTPCAQ